MDEKCTPAGPGGDRNLVNGDEQEILNRCVAGVPSRAEGAQEGDFH
ncbi:hypothetical protein ACFUJU_07900 [Streptomyces sp. NPDC057235]